ncbi:glycoside hydrolase superfamily [Truncatella angustata]|uniref:Glycoside hydrolase superfamily n=1 Tax=Truncatella angustata TaxID=152316 RepID=A0A9P8ZU13_9PEZI|nr:glycoside hydrolase superfamily [Truncatella angustata]KAH6651509.1 glycoside hydrolase superfamily [Truncatella angustata]
MHRSLWNTLCLALSIIGQGGRARGEASCSGIFAAITAQDYVHSLSPGWNLGNTLDAFPMEGSWNNPVVTADTFADVKNSGYNSVRIPVTWAYHFTGSSNQGDSPLWTVDPTWLDRVSAVVDMATAQGLYVIVNVHHDSALWADFTAAGANQTLIEEKFYQLWYQIGTKLGCKGAQVAFEAINEPRSSTDADYAFLHQLQDVFLQAINNAGGFNSQRVITVAGPGQDLTATIERFTAPDSNFTNPWTIQVHYYAPYDFTSAAWGKTIWGSADDKAAMDSAFSSLRAKFPNIPLIVGEWSASPVITEPAARWKYIDFLARTAAKYDAALIVWDAGVDVLNHSAHTWYDITAVNIVRNAIQGISNSLPDSTTDPSATTQQSSAFIFNQVGSSVGDQSLPFLLNGNTVTSITIDSTMLTTGNQYSVSGNNIIFTASFLSGYLSSTATPGIKGTLSISFSAGIIIPVQIVQWEPPVLSSASSKAIAGADLVVPVTWQGMAQVATVKAVKADGTFLVDDWTVWLPPIQQGRTTFGGSWTWSVGQAGFTITSTAVNAVIAAGQATQFTVEAYPRVAGNSATYTLNP